MIEIKPPSPLLLLIFACLLPACSSSALRTTSSVYPTPSSLPSHTALHPTVLPTITPFSVPTQTRTLVPSRTATATATPIPPTVTASSTPTVTIWPTLAPNGPYLLVYYGSVEGQLTFNILNPDGDGRKVIQLPKYSILYPDSYIYHLVSLDGKWLAFYIAEGGYEVEGLTLNLMHLPDGAVRTVAQVLPADYQIGQGVVATALPTSLPTEWVPEESFDHLNLGLMDYIENIKTIAWSPDSRYLAFAGQIDGPSSDLYVYDLQENIIQRLTDDFLNISSIYWSPDGKWLLYTNTIPGHPNPGDILYAIEPFSSSVNEPMMLYGGFHWMGWGWLSPVLHVITGAFDGGFGNLRSINIETGNMQEIWPGSYEVYTWDPKTKRLYVSGEVDNTDPGTYTISMDASYQKISPTKFWWMLLRDNPTHLLIGLEAASSNAIALTRDGKTVSLSNLYKPLISISPNDRWLVIYNEFGMELLDDNDQIVHSFPDVSVTGTGLRWRPDSSGFYFASDQSLYYLPIPYDEPSLVDTCLIDFCDYYYGKIVWLP